jgi:hypothetical protein
MLALEKISPDPVYVKRAISQRAEPISPFQYYSKVGESIYVLDFYSHKFNACLYLHFDVDGSLLARVLHKDEQQSGALAEWTRMEKADLDLLVNTDADFADLLSEMHLAASQVPHQLFLRDELDLVKQQSKKAPIVIGGCGRSGTTLLLSILGAHPNILAFADELYCFYPRPFRLKFLLAAIEAQERNDWQRWCEKTPKNVRAFKEINQAFGGDVRLIHMVRDGRAVVCSHHPNDANRYYVSPERWVADVSAGLEFGNEALLVHYEDLVAGPEKTLKELCEFIGEKLDERMLSFENYSSVKENKAWEGKQAKALHEGRIDSWRAQEHEARVQEFLAYPRAVELNRSLGYAD